MGRSATLPIMTMFSIYKDKEVYCFLFVKEDYCFLWHVGNIFILFRGIRFLFKIYCFKRSGEIGIRTGLRSQFLFEIRVQLSWPLKVLKS